MGRLEEQSIVVTGGARYQHTECLGIGQFGKRYTPLLYSVEKSPRLRRAN
jgi:hypothetical protein